MLRRSSLISGGFCRLLSNSSLDEEFRIKRPINRISGGLIFSSVRGESDRLEPSKVFSLALDWVFMVNWEGSSVIVLLVGSLEIRS